MIQLKPILLKKSIKYNEKWVQDIIANDPKVLGLGALMLKDKERRQPHAGRLDLLLQDSENKRYEVEIQLGATDESHLVRTIEYWDIESKRYPQYKHCAVIVAEDITTRFLNVINLFNGFIPIVAIKMTAYEVNGEIGLTFTKILNERGLGLVDEDDDPSMDSDEKSWGDYTAAMDVANSVAGFINGCGIKVKLNEKKHFIGLMEDEKASNFVWFVPRKDCCVVCFRIERNDESDRIVEGMSVDTLDYDTKNSSYRIKLESGDVSRCEDAIKSLIASAYKFHNS